MTADNKQPDEFKCQTCGDIFTVFPNSNNAFWENCLGEYCPSYSVDRDPYAIEAMYGIGMERDTP